MGTGRWFPIGGEPRGVRRRGVAAVSAALLITVGLGAGCSPITDAAGAPTPVAVVPAEWFDARNAAQRQGTNNLASFYAPDVQLDHRALGPARIQGRDAALDHYHEAWSTSTLVRTRDGQPFLGVDSAATIERIDTIMSNLQRQALFLTRIAPEGALSETLALSVMTLRASSPADPRVGAIHTLADRYANAWSTASEKGVGALYAPDATVFDTMLGLQVEGHDITDLAGRTHQRGGLAELGILQLPGFAGPAIYGAGRPGRDTPMDLAAVVLSTAQGAPCPHLVAIELVLGDHGLIVREERFHRVADVRACASRVAIPPGWWDVVEIPESVRSVLTGSPTLGGSTVEVYNGTPELERLLAWAFDRFTIAGLEAPRLASVTFLDGLTDVCHRKRGLTVGDDVLLCFQKACSTPECNSWWTWPRATVLHELAHVWMAQTMPEGTPARFVRAADLPTWASTKQPWGQRGTELAAETIAWALMDQPYRINPDLEERSCAELAHLFQILTGINADPVPLCPYPEPEGSG
jgi:hypothetical protein